MLPRLLMHHAVPYDQSNAYTEICLTILSTDLTKPFTWVVIFREKVPIGTKPRYKERYFQIFFFLQCSLRPKKYFLFIQNIFKLMATYRWISNILLHLRVDCHVMTNNDNAVYFVNGEKKLVFYYPSSRCFIS